MKLLGDWNWRLPRPVRWLPQITPPKPARQPTSPLQPAQPAAKAHNNRNSLLAPSNLGANRTPPGFKRRPRDPTAIYFTPGISTGHCDAAIIGEPAHVDGINSIVVDREARLLRVTADQIDDAAVIAAVDKPDTRR